MKFFQNIFFCQDSDYFYIHKHTMITPLKQIKQKKNQNKTQIFLQNTPMQTSLSLLFYYFIYLLRNQSYGIKFKIIIKNNMQTKSFNVVLNVNPQRIVFNCRHIKYIHICIYTLNIDCIHITFIRIYELCTVKT